MIRDGFFIKLPLTSVLPDTAKQIRGELNYDAPGKEYSPQFIKHQWDGKYYLFSKAGMFWKFPYGLIERVAKFLPIPIERILPQVAQSDEWKGHVLGEEQALAVEKALNTDRGLIIHPTGSGKMTLISALTNQLGNYRVLVLCYYSKAVKDTCNEMIKSGLTKVQRLGSLPTKANPVKCEDARIVVATHAAFLRGNVNKNAGDFDVVIVDECEMFASAKNYKMIQITNPKFLYGLTATDFRTDGKDILINAVFGEVLVRFTHKEATDKGILSKTKAFGLKQTIITNEFDQVINISQYPPHHRQRVGYWLNTDRNKKIIALNHKLTELGITHLILTNSTEHVGELFRLGLLGDSLIRDDYDGVVERLNNKEIMSVISTKANRSINIPTLDAVIDTALQFNKGLLIQRHGRLARRSAGKRGYYYFFLDTWKQGYTNKIKTLNELGVKPVVSKELEECLLMMK